MADAHSPALTEGPGLARRIPAALALLVASFSLWRLGMDLRGGRGPLFHSPADQHTRQAIAWLHGRIDLESAPPDLEIAEYRGRYYNSFPPTPTLVELPLVLGFGRETPSSLALYAFWLLALYEQRSLLRRRGFSEVSSVAAPMAFLFATNVFPSCVHASVWAQGQSLGYCLAVWAVSRVAHNPASGWRGPAAGYFLLSLAVGCRPFYLFTAPLLMAIDRFSNSRLARACARDALCWMLPYGLLLGAYNWARFRNPLEFGHRYLPWPQRLPHGMFSFRYVPWNAYHAFLRLPAWSTTWPYVRFDSMGSAFWLHNAPLVIGVLGLVTPRLDRSIRWTAVFGLLATGLGVLMYESAGSRLLPPGIVVPGSGNHQVGFRYFIDLLPIAFGVFAFSYTRFTGLMAAASLVTFSLNLYALAFWPEVRVEPPDVRIGAQSRPSGRHPVAFEVQRGHAGRGSVRSPSPEPGGSHHPPCWTNETAPRTIGHTPTEVPCPRSIPTWSS